MRGTGGEWRSNVTTNAPQTWTEGQGRVLADVEPHYEPPPNYSFRTVTDKISSIVLTRPTSRVWLACFAANFALVMLLLYGIVYLLAYGVGIWGINIPVAWGF